ncbi:hypothetical protein IAR50_006899 [Cryptococcus sp. DSM 104548]
MSSSPPPSPDDDAESIQATQFQPTEDDVDELYDAIRILDERVKKGKGEYLVEWAGIDPDTGETWLPEWTAKTSCTNDLIKEWRAVKKRDPNVVGKAAAKWEVRIREYQKWKEELERKKAKVEREARLKASNKKRKRESTAAAKQDKKSRMSREESSYYSKSVTPRAGTSRSTRRSTRDASIETERTETPTRWTRESPSPVPRAQTIESDEEPALNELEPDEDDDDELLRTSAKSKGKERGKEKGTAATPARQPMNGSKTKPKKRILQVSNAVTDLTAPSQASFTNHSPGSDDDTDPQFAQYPNSSPARPEPVSLEKNTHLPSSSAEEITQFASPPFMRYERNAEVALRKQKEFEEATALAKAVAGLPGMSASGKKKGKAKARQEDETEEEGVPSQTDVFDDPSLPESQIPETQAPPSAPPQKSPRKESSSSDDDLRKLKKENARLQRQLQEALEARASMEDTVEHHPDTAALEKARAESAKRRNDLATAQADVEEARAKAKGEGAERSEELRMLEELKKEMEGLRKELSAAKLGKDQSDERYKNHPDSSALVESQAEVAEVRKQLAAAQQSRQETEKKAREHSAAVKLKSAEEHIESLNAKLKSAEEHVETLSAKLEEAGGVKERLSNEVGSLNEQLEALERARVSAVEDQLFVRTEFEKARDRAVELAQKSDKLNKQNELLRSQLKDGLKQREMFNHATSSAHGAQVKQLRAQVKILLDQARVTGDPVREKAVWCDKYREDNERLEAEKAELDRKLRKAKGRQVELFEENQVLRARAMGVLPPESEGESDEDDGAARGYMTAEEVPARRPFPLGPSGLANNLPSSPQQDFFLTAPEAQRNFAHPPGNVSGQAAAGKDGEEVQVEELVEGGRGYECKWREGEEACRVVCDTAEDMLAHSKQHPVAEMAARGAL